MFWISTITIARKRLRKITQTFAHAVANGFCEIFWMQ